MNKSQYDISSSDEESTGYNSDSSQDDEYFNDSSEDDLEGGAYSLRGLDDMYGGKVNPWPKFLGAMTKKGYTSTEALGDDESQPLPLLLQAYLVQAQ